MEKARQDARSRGDGSVGLMAIALLMVLLSACAGGATPSPSPASPATAPAEPAAPPNGGWQPAWSPDGRWVAFLSSPLHLPTDLWIVEASGGQARRLTTHGVQSFRWSAEGASIQVSTSRLGFEELVEIDLQTGEEHRVPGLPPGASPPIYSPDGELFAFTARAEGKTRDLWIGTIDGSRIEAVTEKMGVRSVFWGPESRRVYFEPGKDYGIGLWELDLATMESSVLLDSYLGTPSLSPSGGRIAYPSPTKPGEYAVKTCDLDGGDEETHSAPRLGGLRLSWDGSGTGVFYLGTDRPPGPPESEGDTAGQDEGEEETPGGHGGSRGEPAGPQVTSLWHLSLATGAETRVSSPELHVVGFEISPDGGEAVLSALLPESRSTELFRLTLAPGELTRLARSRPSYWMPVPSRDSSRIAFFTNASGVNALEVVSAEGEPLATYPGVALEGNTNLFWLPESESLLLFSPRGLLAFNEEGPIAFPNRKDHRAYLHADVSLRSDKVLISGIPRYGQLPGLYLLEVDGSEFVQTDLRYPPPPETAAELYLQPRWSFDERRVAFTDRIDLWVMSSDGTGRKWITDFATANVKGEGTPTVIAYPVWSVRGEWIAHTRIVYGEEGVLRELWIIRPDGSDARRLFSEPVDSEVLSRLEDFTNPPFFDVMDERVIFTAAPEGIPDLFAVEIESGEVRRLTSGGALYPVLLPEEDLILYTSLRDGRGSLWVMEGDGSAGRPFYPRTPEAGE